MLVKLLLVALAISVVPTQAEEKIVDSIQEWSDTLKRIKEVYEKIQQIKEFDPVEWVNDLDSEAILRFLALYVLDNHVNNLPDEVFCLLRLRITTDRETDEEIREFFRELQNYVNLNREYRELEAECEAIDNTGILGIAAQHSCYGRLYQIQRAINISSAKLSVQFVRLRQTWADGVRCLTGSRFDRSDEVVA